MRFRITFSRSENQKMLPVDYQYFISAWIYKVLMKADHSFADFLHRQGYFDGNKKFRHFCYSPFWIGSSHFWKEKSLLEVHSNTLSLDISFGVEEAAEQFIIGLFRNQHAYIGNRFNGLELLVTLVERLPDLVCREEMAYTAWSPVVVSLQKANDRYATYLSPEEPEYGDLLLRNLSQKWKTLPGAPPFPGTGWDFRLLNTPRSKLVTVKSFTSRESKIRGYQFRFQLKAPVEVHRLILSSGLGEKNSTGFGWVDPLREWPDQKGGK
jgi:CRISPR-associated endoribonuclease Cas6